MAAAQAVTHAPAAAVHAPASEPVGAPATAPDPPEAEPPAAGKPETTDPKTRTTARKSSLRFTPKTVLELIEHAYAGGGKKLSLAADLTSLEADVSQAEAEMHRLRTLAASDRLLAVPPQVLTALASVNTEYTARRRILELMLAALADHPVFLAYRKQLLEPDAEPRLDARNVSDATQVVTYLTLGYKDSNSFTADHREKMRVNAVMSFALLRVLRDRWSPGWFAESMSALVWNALAPKTAQGTVAALVGGQRDDALSQLVRHFEGKLAEIGRQIQETERTAASQVRRATRAEEQQLAVSAELHAERQHVADLTNQVAALKETLEAERGNRVVDHSHHVDDYETLRTRVLRQLSEQADLLTDGLHALRHERLAVADEFVDRALTAIKKEVAHVREMDKYRL
jgi:septal ring factor EnvC (AmiA/AmiB activator)